MISNLVVWTPEQVLSPLTTMKIPSVKCLLMKLWCVNRLGLTDGLLDGIIRQVMRLRSMNFCRRFSGFRIKTGRMDQPSGSWKLQRDPIKILEFVNWVVNIGKNIPSARSCLSRIFIRRPAGNNSAKDSWMAKVHARSLARARRPGDNVYRRLKPFIIDLRF